MADSATIYMEMYDVMQTLLAGEAFTIKSREARKRSTFASRTAIGADTV